MASRWEQLAVRAHLRQAIDYRTERGPYLDVKEELVFSVLEDEAAAEVTSLVHTWHSSAAAADPFDSEVFEFHRNGADQAFKTIGRLKLPWYERWSKEDARELHSLLRKFYEQEKDPEFRKWRDSAKKQLQDRIKSRYDAQEARKQSIETLKRKGKEAEERQRKRRERARRT